MTLCYLRPLHKGILVGANTVGGSFAIEDARALAGKIGRSLDLVMFYQAFGAEPALYTSQFTTAAALGAVPQSVWQPSGVLVPGQVLKGMWDPYIDDSAIQCRNFKRPMQIRFAHEMNGNWMDYGPNQLSDADYVAMWRYVVTRFRQAGASNVQWVWSPNIWTVSNGAISHPGARYPGDAYVDIVGLDGYQSLKNDKWYSFTDLYADDHRSMLKVAPGKPFAISEFGQGEHDTRGSRHAWMIEALAKAIPSMNNMRYVTFFDRNKKDGEGDYTLDVSGTDQAGIDLISGMLNEAPYA